MLHSLKKLSTALKKFNAHVMIDALIIYATSNQFEIGDEVRILQGKHSGLKGEIVDIDRNIQTAYLKIMMFGRAVASAAPLGDLELTWRSGIDPQDLPNIQMLTVLDPEENFQVLYRRSQDDPLRFIKEMTPIFDQLDNQKTGLVERIVQQETENMESYRNWKDSVEPFLIQNPEYINYSIIGDKLFTILSSTINSPLLNLIPEALLFETWEKASTHFSRPTSLGGISSIIAVPTLFKSLLSIYPNFMEMLGFYLAQNDPARYLNEDLDQAFKDKIDKEDVVGNLFNVNTLSFLQSTDVIQGKYPELEKKAIHKIIYDADSSPEELSFFFTSPKQYWARKDYSLWTLDAIDKFTKKYPKYLNYLEKFLDTELGREMSYKMAINLINNKDYHTFFQQHYKNIFPSLAEQAAKDILENGTDEDLIQIYQNFYLDHLYPQFSSKFHERMRAYNNRPPETEEERQVRYEREDAEREKRFQQYKNPFDLDEEPESEADINPDPDYQEDFERGQ
mgnify:FL=1